MVSSSRIALVASFAAGIALTVSSQAHAAGNEPVPSVAPAQPAPAANADKPQEVASTPERKFLSLELNPLAAAVGRYSIQAEYMPLAHHAIVLNPHYDSFNYDVSLGNTSVKEEFTGFGTELGYRFYTGEKGMNGFFVGPSFIIGSYKSSVGDQSVSFLNYGAAVDIGGQAVIGPGVVVGAGFGLQWTKSNQDLGDLNLQSKALAGGGVAPRFLLSVGYAF